MRRRPPLPPTTRLHPPRSGDNATQLQTAEGYGYHDVSSHPAPSAARVVVQLLRERLMFSSVLDVGCGIGLWLREFQAQGVTDFLGLDGAWVPRDRLVIPADQFRVHDLCTPFRLERTFELVLSLEVAEHLPLEAADDFVSSLIAHGSTVVFSAAIPGQGGFLHVNEQFQDFWIDKFAAHGYTAYEVLRPVLWTHPEVPYYYAQNLLVYSRDCLPYPTEFVTTPVHPEQFRRRTDPRDYSMRALLRNLPHYARRLWRRASQ